VLATALLIRPAPAAATAPAPTASGAMATSAGTSSPWSALRTPQFVVLAATSIYSVEGVAGLFGRLAFGLLADRVGVKRVIIGGLLLQAVGIYSYIFVNGLGDFYARALVLGMAYGGVMPLYA